MQTKNISKKKVYWLSVAIVGAVLGVTLQFAQAWVDPTSPAPGGEVGAPITTSPMSQIKIGSLTLGASGKTANLHVNGKICFGLNDSKCISDWSEISGGGASYAPKLESFGAGSHEFVIPAGVPAGSYMKVELWGGGGGGAIGRKTKSAYNYENITGGGSGAAGGYAFAEVKVYPGDTMGVYVGAGGTGGNNKDATYVNSAGDKTDYAGAGEETYLYKKESDGKIIKLVSASGGEGGHDYDFVWSAGDWWLAHACNGYAAKGGDGKADALGDRVYKNFVNANTFIHKAGGNGTGCYDYFSPISKSAFNMNKDWLPAGLSYISPNRKVRFGDGGDGRFWGTNGVDAQYVCSVLSRSCEMYDDEGNCATWGSPNVESPIYSTADLSCTFGNCANPYLQVSCSKVVSAVSDYNPKGNFGKAGGAFISW